MRRNLLDINDARMGVIFGKQLSLTEKKGIVNGVGADTDIIVASAKAYIAALNKLQSKIERINPQV